MAETPKEYAMSNAELCMLASNLVVFMTRDAVQFALRGVTAGDITAFEAKGNAFEIFPPDDDYIGLITIETNAKNELRLSLIYQIRTISGFFDQKWGVSSGEYRRLGIKGLHNLSDPVFLVRARGVVRLGTEYLTALTPVGLTQALLDTLEDDAQLFEDKLNAIAEKRALRDKQAKIRTDMGNELYSYCSQYAKIGKLIWEITDEALYNDYVIYKTEHHNLSKPQNVAAVYDPMNPPDITLSWDAVIDATNYDVFYNIANMGAPSGEYNLLNNFLASPAYIPSIIGKRNYFKIKAKNDKLTSIYSDEAYIDVPVS